MPFKFPKKSSDPSYGGEDGDTSKSDPEKLDMRKQALMNRQKLRTDKPGKKNPREKISSSRYAFNEAISRRLNKSESSKEDQIVTKRKTDGY